VSVGRACLTKHRSACFAGCFNEPSGE
jgi:hypothetical protein